MRLLEERISKDGQALNESVLKVGSFLNIQVDPDLMETLGKDFADHFADFGINKVVTIESSGIAPALMAAKYLKVPLVIMKKSTSKILDGEVLQTRVMSYTKGIEYRLTIHENYIHPGENILLIDDFIANGEAAKGAVHLIEEAGATVAGIGIVIEKSFQAGRKQLEKAGYKVYSQARIARLSKGVIEYMELE